MAMVIGPCVLVFACRLLFRSHLLSVSKQMSCQLRVANEFTNICAGSGMVRVPEAGHRASYRDGRGFRWRDGGRNARFAARVRAMMDERTRSRRDAAIKPPGRVGRAG